MLKRFSSVRKRASIAVTLFIGMSLCIPSCSTFLLMVVCSLNCYVEQTLSCYATCWLAESSARQESDHVRASTWATCQ